jgi:transcriptional regulator with XRE-family HTH domain
MILPLYDGRPVTGISLRFGHRLRKLRLKAGLSQDQMSHLFGVGRGHISDLERGKKNVGLPILERLSKGLGISLSELMRDV